MMDFDEAKASRSDAEPRARDLVSEMPVLDRDPMDHETGQQPSRQNMLKKITSAAGCAAIVGLALVLATSAGAALELITATEAALPNAADAVINYRGITRDPKVVVISPAPNAGIVRSPLNLLLKFEAFGGATIDPRFVNIVYLKRPNINLTQRVGQLIGPNGIEVNNVEVPPGTHHIRVDLKDNAGRVGSTTFALTVAN